ncbi:MAG: InlB B-repeat-containing protein, partial [Bacteroidaceae bacterium]|nr:InlB B-repeat-containing protein [Bacteroidaceae bacterium]
MKRALCICMAWSGLGLAMQAQTSTLTTQTTNIVQGKEAVLNVMLTNGVEISGGQFTVTLPQGITVKEVTLNEERSNAHTLEYRLEGNNAARILFYAQPTSPLKGNEGTLCTLSLEAAPDMASGEYEVSFSNIRLAVDATTTAEVNAVEGSLKVIPCYTVKVEATEGGSVEGGGIFVEGDRVTLKAIPDEGYHFEQWSDGSTDTPYTFDAKEHVTLTARFAPNAYNLIYVIDGVEYKRVSVLYKSEVEGIVVEAREGHTFSGWSGLPATMPARDVTVNGSFTVNKYLVTFKIGDVVVSSKSLAYGTAIVAPDAPEKEGYTFDGWGEVAETVPAHDVTYEGSYSVNSYMLTFVVDGETVQSESVAYGTAITMPEAPVKEGHTFSGWSEMPETMPAKDVTISGTFAINSYTVTYQVDGEVYKTESLAYGSKLTAIASPVKEGYTFSGWSEMPETMPAKDITVSGRFTVNSYTVTFVLEGDVLAEYTLQYGSAIEVPKVPIKEGLSFSGWGKVLETMPARDLIYEGSYMNNAYTIIYMVDGVEYCRVMVEYGGVIELVASPVKEGYTFSGWSEVPETMPAEDVIISGTFAINSYTVTYQVDGEVYKTESLAYGSKLTAIASPVKEGHTFSGWSEMPETMPAEDVIISGTFAINSYLVTFKVDGEVVSSESMEYGASIVAPDAPEKEGHTFAGWGEVAETVPAHDVTYEGGYSVNSYLLTFVVDGETVQSESVAYGTAITMPEAPVKEGHTFSGWSEMPETMPAKDVTISGTFAINSYTVTYVVDGEVYKTESLAYGSKLTAIASPVKEGHTFSGWSEMPETMPAEDVIISGTFAINSYLVTFKVDGEVVS